MSYKIRFKENFARLLRENFRSPAEIAVYFECTAQMADNYLNEISVPGGDKVAKIAFDERYAESAKKYLKNPG